MLADLAVKVRAKEQIDSCVVRNMRRGNLENNLLAQEPRQGLLTAQNRARPGIGKGLALTIDG